jgi:DNA (cytosine-5)-methyltransferase 1
MIFGSVCSGIEAASVAWHFPGWRAAFLAETAAFPRAVLKRHYPDVPLHGDFTTIARGEYEPIDVLVGGTPSKKAAAGRA